MRRAIVLVDGEHHPTVVADALRELSAGREIVAVAFCGGGEKVAPEKLPSAESSTENVQSEVTSLPLLSRTE